MLLTKNRHRRGQDYFKATEESKEAYSTPGLIQLCNHIGLESYAFLPGHCSCYCIKALPCLWHQAPQHIISGLQGKEGEWRQSSFIYFIISALDQNSVLLISRLHKVTKGGDENFRNNLEKFITDFAQMRPWHLARDEEVRARTVLVYGL